MNITTKKGDGGTTDLLEGGRVSKDDPRIECLGVIDELDAFLADVLLYASSSGTAETVRTIRNELSAVLMPAVVRSPSANPDTAYLESRIAELETSQKGFVHTWTDPAAIKLNIARAVCRRAERRAVRLNRQNNSAANTAVYLNRLSDLLFLLAVSEEK